MKSGPLAHSYLRCKRHAASIFLVFNLISLAQVQHVLGQWTSGECVKGTKRFSGENGNKEDIVTVVDPHSRRKIHKRVVEHRTTLFMDTIEAKFDDNI